MPQNWWELFPEVIPSPFARRRPLPGPPIARPMSAPYRALGPDQGPPGAFDPSYFSGGELGNEELAGPYSGDTAQSGYAPPFFAGDAAGPAMDRDLALKHAAAAIQRGADPDAVRARLHEMGHGDGESPSPFSDLLPKGRPEIMADSAPPPVQARPTFDDQSGLVPGSTGASYARDHLARPSQRIDPRLAPQKAGGFEKSGQQKGGASGQTTLFTYGLPSFPARERGTVQQPDRARPVTRRPDPYSETNLTLGPNEQYRADILAAARFYHLTPHAVAASIGAEVGGRWNPNAANRETHAVGLMQFLPGTWIGEAQRHGSFLNGIAHDLGYLDRQGHIDPARREQFLALRNNPRYSIWAGADYASSNLNTLKRDGFLRNVAPAALARYAYLAHHEGLGGARSFLRGTGNDYGRAFRQNVSPANQARYLAANNNDVGRAYRNFLSDYVDGRVDVSRYMVDREGVAVPPTRSLLR